MREVEALAAAKVNLSLVVRAPRHDRLHPVRGRFQSIDWLDTLVVEPSSEPGIEGADDRPVIDGERNLAWIAASRATARLGRPHRVSVRLDKQIAVAAGLGGGSADAAAALAATAYALDRAVADVASLAPDIGSDVPFCLVGGAADVDGVGDVVRTASFETDHALAIVVPPVEVSTARVFAAWDVLDGPTGRPLAAGALPPSLRDGVELRNDLTDAAVSVAPEIAAWRSELERRWSRPVALSGSGPSLFAFFVDVDEAGAALDVVPGGARHARVASPIPWGWVVRFDGAGDHHELTPVVESDGWHRSRPGLFDATFR